MSKNDCLNGTTLPLRKIRQRESAVPKHRYRRYQIADIINYFEDELLPLLSKGDNLGQLANDIVRLDAESKRFICEMLEKADFNISDIYIKEEKGEVSEEAMVIKTFLVNSGRAQLIFSTHSLMLLDEDFIRRDMVYFASKNESGATEIYRAKDFGLHKEVSILNAYKAGKLGAKPQLGSIFIDE